MPKHEPTIEELEEDLLKRTGLQLGKELFVYEVPIQIKDKNYCIHTYRCGDANSEDLVLLHGYGGSSGLYYKMLKDLSKRFRVFCLDFVGMGLSSREKFECTTPEETIELFVSCVDKWREAVGIDRFFLAGHSFGGYIATQYTLVHEHRVKKLLLLSPVGFTRAGDKDRLIELRKKFGCCTGLIVRLFTRILNSKVTPNSICRRFPRLADFFVGRFISRRMGLVEPEASMAKKFIIKILTLPGGTEQAIHYILKPPVGEACYPLEDDVCDKITIAVDCFFGDTDYMDQVGANRLAKSGKKPNFVVKKVPNAAHQLTVQNPEVMSNMTTTSILEEFYAKQT